MPAPPPDLTAASAAVVWEGKATRRALTTAMLDLASRGELSFKPEGGLLGLHTKTGIQIETPPTDNPYVERNRRRPLSDAEQYALDRLQGIADTSSGNYIAPDDLLQFGKYTSKFNNRIEQHVTSRGWFSEPPAKAVNALGRARRRWPSSAGSSCFIIGFNLPSAGFELMGGALVAAGVLVMLISRCMPQRTMAGAMIYAMLAAYRRTLAEDDGAGALDEPGRPGGRTWRGSRRPTRRPSGASRWGSRSDVEAVIERSAEDAQQGVSTYNPWVPIVVRHRLVVRRRQRRLVGRRARSLLGLAHPRLRRHVLRARLDRQLAQLERQRRIGRLRRRRSAVAEAAARAEASSLAAQSGFGR